MLLRASCLFQLYFWVAGVLITFVLMLLRASCLFQLIATFYTSDHNNRGLNAPSSFLSIPTLTHTPYKPGVDLIVLMLLRASCLFQL